MSLDQTQQEFVRKYQAIHVKLNELEQQMQSIKDQTKTLLEDLERLREEESKIYKENNNG